MDPVSAALPQNRRRIFVATLPFSLLSSVPFFGLLIFVYGESLGSRPPHPVQNEWFGLVGRSLCYLCLTSWDPWSCGGLSCSLLNKAGEKAWHLARRRVEVKLFDQLCIWPMTIYDENIEIWFRTQKLQNAANASTYLVWKDNIVITIIPSVIDLNLYCIRIFKLLFFTFNFLE